MVKHQRRAHQQGGADLEDADEDDTSDSDTGESPTTPGMISPGWTENLYTQCHATMTDYQPSHRAQPVPETTHQYGSYMPLEESRTHRQSSSQSPVEGLNQRPPPYQHYTEAIIGRPIEAKQQPLYLPERNNPGIATMNVNANTDHPPYMPANRLLPYNSQSIQRTGSPASYSSGSIQTPPPQEVYYAHPPAQKSAFNPHYPGEQGQQYSGVQYQQSQYQPMMQQQPPMRLVPQDNMSHQNSISPIQQHSYQQHFAQQHQPQEQLFSQNSTPYQQAVQVAGGSYPSVNNFHQAEAFGEAPAATTYQ